MSFECVLGASFVFIFLLWSRSYNRCFVLDRQGLEAFFALERNITLVDTFSREPRQALLVPLNSFGRR